MTSTIEPLFALEQCASRGTTLMSLAVLVPAACSVLIPMALLATHTHAVAAAIQEQPVAALQVAAGIALWTGLFLVPTIRCLKRLGLSRRVRIADGQVSEVITTPFGRHQTSRALSGFAGVVHRVRTSVGDVSHELALVDCNGHETVFHVARRLTRTDIERALSSLKLPELSVGRVPLKTGTRDLFSVLPAGAARAA